MNIYNKKIEVDIRKSQPFKIHIKDVSSKTISFYNKLERYDEYEKHFNKLCDRHIEHIMNNIDNKNKVNWSTYIFYCYDENMFNHYLSLIHKLEKKYKMVLNT